MPKDQVRQTLYCQKSPIIEQHFTSIFQPGHRELSPDMNPGEVFDANKKLLLSSD
jgi:hypothetical protein